MALLTLTCVLLEPIQIRRFVTNISLLLINWILTCAVCLNLICSLWDRPFGLINKIQPNFMESNRPWLVRLILSQTWGAEFWSLICTGMIKSLPCYDHVIQIRIKMKLHKNLMLYKSKTPTLEREVCTNLFSSFIPWLWFTYCLKKRNKRVH